MPTSSIEQPRPQFANNLLYACARRHLRRSELHLVSAAGGRNATSRAMAHPSNNDRSWHEAVHCRVHTAVARPPRTGCRNRGRSAGVRTCSPARVSRCRSPEVPALKWPAPNLSSGAPDGGDVSVWEQPAQQSGTSSGSSPASRKCSAGVEFQCFCTFIITGLTTKRRRSP